MKALRTAAVALALLSVPAALAQDDEPSLQRVLAAVGYLSSSVPEHQTKAEALVRANAARFYETLEQQLPQMRDTGRVKLLQVLSETEHERRIPLCMQILGTGDARRTERILAFRALRGVDGDKLLQNIEQRLESDELTPYLQMQLCALLGTLTSARAQGVAESLLDRAKPASLEAFAAEDAALRSTLDSLFAQPAWSRYQERHSGAPSVTLKTLQEAMDRLALPGAPDRALAETRLIGMIGGDERLLLAMCRSRWPERAAFALRRLQAEPPRRLALAAQLVMLDIATTGEQTLALLAMDVGIAARPPTGDELVQLRRYASTDAMARLEAIMESMKTRGDLAALRLQNERLTARLRPLLLRRGPADDETAETQNELRAVRQRLEGLERAWEQGWRTEFESEILSPRSN